MGNTEPTQSMKPFWKQSKVYRDKRRVVHLGAFAKWAREHPEEREYVESRFRMTHPNLENPSDGRTHRIPANIAAESNRV